MVSFAANRTTYVDRVKGALEQVAVSTRSAEPTFTLGAVVLVMAFGATEVTFYQCGAYPIRMLGLSADHADSRIPLPLRCTRADLG
jgi:hypothetical protein